MINERIVFMGTPLFAANVLDKLLEKNFPIVGVVTQPDTFVGRKRILTAPAVKEVAIRHNLPVFQPAKIRQDYEEILALKPSLIITCAYGQIIPKAILENPVHGCINTHGSLLPKLRGGAPIQRSIMQGDSETGITLMYMNEKMDEGDILLQEKLAILDSDTNETLFEKMSFLAADMLICNLDKLFRGELKAFPQNHQEASYAPNLRKEDEFISFCEGARESFNHVRGLLENPGAYGVLEGENYKFFEVSYDCCVRGEKGTFLGLIDKKIAVAVKGGTLFFGSIQAPGKKKMDAVSFFNGKGKSLVGKVFASSLQ